MPRGRRSTTQAAKPRHTPTHAPIRIDRRDHACTDSLRDSREECSSSTGGHLRRPPRTKATQTTSTGTFGANPTHQPRFSKRCSPTAAAVTPSAQDKKSVTTFVPVWPARTSKGSRSVEAPNTTKLATNNFDSRLDGIQTDDQR